MKELLKKQHDLESDLAKRMELRRQQQQDHLNNSLAQRRQDRLNRLQQEQEQERAEVRDRSPYRLCLPHSDHTFIILKILLSDVLGCTETETKKGEENSNNKGDFYSAHHREYKLSVFVFSFITACGLGVYLHGCVTCLHMLCLACVNMHFEISVRGGLHTHMHICMHSCACTCTHTQTHTHTHIMLH